MSSWQISQASSSFASITKDWDELNQHLYQSHPLLDTRFITALLHHFGDGTIKLAVYRSIDNKIQNIFLLKQSRLGTWSTFLPSQAQIAPILCSYPESLPGLFKALAPLSLSLDILSQDPDFTFQLSSLDYYKKSNHATTMNIGLQGTFKEYWGNRSKNLQRNVKRYFNRLNKNNIDIHYKIHGDAISLKNALIRYGNMESKSWKGREGTAINKNNQQGLFYLDIVSSFAKTSQAEIVELYFNDQLAASRINIFNDEVLVILKTTYDESLSKFSPGRLLLYLLIEHEFSLKRTNKIEFYTNATADQLSWSTEKRSIEHITLYKSIYIQKTFQLIRHFKKKLTKKTSSTSPDN